MLHTTAGPVTPRLTQAGVDEALSLFDEQSARARLARKRQTTEQWLRQVAPDATVDPVPAVGSAPATDPAPMGGQPPVAGLPAPETPAETRTEGPQHG
jgi:putative membrane protein